MSSYQVTIIRYVLAIIAAVCVIGHSSTALGQTPVDSTWIGPDGGMWNDMANWNPDQVPNNSGSFSFDVVIDGDDGTDKSVLLNMNSNVDSLSIGAGDSLSVLDTFDLSIGSGFLMNDGMLTLDSEGSITQLNTRVTPFTLGGSGAVHMGEDVNNRIRTQALNWVLINDVNHTISGAGYLGVNTCFFDNRGTVDANSSSPMNVNLRGGSANNVNVGTMQASNGGTLFFDDTGIDNTGGIIQALDGSAVQLSNSTITGGTLTTAGTGEIQASANSSRFDNITNTGTIIGLDSIDPIFSGTITNNGTIVMNSTGSDTDFNVGSDPLIMSGTGNLVLEEGGSNRINGTTFNWTLVNDVDHTISGAGAFGVNVVFLENNGTISADRAQPLSLDLRGTQENNANSGVMEAVDGGTLQLVGTVIDNSNGEIVAREGSTVALNSGSRILGGIVTTEGTGVVQFTGNGATLEQVTNEGDIETPNGTDPVVAGVFTNNGTLSLNSEGAITHLSIGSNPTMFTGSGSLIMVNQSNNRIGGTAFGHLLINDSTHTIQGSGQLGINVISLQNDGLIESNQEVPLVLDLRETAVENTNNGIMRAVDGGVLRFSGTILNNENGILRAMNASTVSIAGSTIIGGVLETEGTGQIECTSNAAVLDSVTNEGLINVPNGIDPVIRGSVVNNSVISMNSTGSSTDLQVGADEAILGGTGELLMNSSLSNRISGSTFNLLFIHEAPHTIRGAGSLGLNVIDFDNRGNIVADDVATAMRIDPRNFFVNSGLLHASGEAGMTILAGPLSNTGSIRVDESSTLTRTESIVQTAGSTVVNGLMVVNSGIFDLQGGVLGGNGTVDANVTCSGGRVNPGESFGELHIDGDYTQQPGGTLRIEIGGTDAGVTHDILDVNGVAMIDGQVIATVDPDSGFQPQIGDTFDILASDDLIGTFSEVSGIAGPGLTFEAIYDEISVSLRVVPCDDSTQPFVRHDDGLDGQTQPFSGYIDPRIESSDGVNFDRGLDTVTILLSEPGFKSDGTELDANSVSITQTGGATPNITNVDISSNPKIIVKLNRPLTPQEWTTVIVSTEDACGNVVETTGNAGPGVDEPDRVDIGSLPGDVDQSTSVSPLDLFRFRQLVNGVLTPDQGVLTDFIDADRSGEASPLDLFLFRQMINGVSPPATMSWAGASMNNPRP